MIFGAMSDTHGNSVLMHEAACTMKDEFGADLIFHLGDDYEDAVELEMAGYEVRKVPGLWCPAYHDSRVPRHLLETVDGVAVACAHAEKDLRAVERAASIILIGHTHTASLQLLGRSLYVNPGHLKARVSRGRRASFALIEIAPHAVHARILGLEGTARTHLTVDRSRLG